MRLPLFTVIKNVASHCSFYLTTRSTLFLPVQVSFRFRMCSLFLFIIMHFLLYVKLFTQLKNALRFVESLHKIQECVLLCSLYSRRQSVMFLNNNLINNVGIIVHEGINKDIYCRIYGLDVCTILAPSYVKSVNSVIKKFIDVTSLMTYIRILAINRVIDIYSVVDVFRYVNVFHRATT